MVHELDDLIGKGIKIQIVRAEILAVTVTWHVRGDDITAWKITECRSPLGGTSAKSVEKNKWGVCGVTDGLIRNEHSAFSLQPRRGQEYALREPHGVSWSEYVDCDGQYVADTAREHEQVPNSVIKLEFFPNKKHHAACVAKPSCHNERQSTHR